ncbi:MAG: hypothetical protein DMG32_25920 [Acidobacteria bacterium]|nr:MAG: hypothetical protein DMG32_25920 [Acidobacteriota bacterium]
MGGIALLADYLAFRFGASWLAWAAAFLFWMAIYDYAKSKTPPLIRRGAPIGAALVLIPITVAITGSFVIKRHTLNTKERTRFKNALKPQKGGDLEVQMA